MGVVKNNMSGLHFCRLSVASVFMLIFALAPSPVVAQGIVQVQCNKDSAGSIIYLDEKLKGNCPLNLLSIPQGEYRLRAVKTVGPDKERVYETILTVGSGATMKRVRVRLGQPQLTASAMAAKEREKKRLERERKLAEKRLREEQRLEQARKAKIALKKAEQGDLQSMYDIAGYLRAGNGIAADLIASQKWQKKAEELSKKMDFEAALDRAKRGDGRAMREISEMYRNGRGVNVDEEQASIWTSKADKAEVQSLVNSANEGHVQAILALADRYDEGRGVEKNPKEAKRLRDIVRRARIDAERSRIDFFYFTKDMLSGELWADPDKDLASASSTVVLSPVSTATGLVMDLVSLPSNVTGYFSVEDEIAYHPSVYFRPNSMMAKSYTAALHRAP